MTKRELSDHVLAGVKAILHLVPHVGGAVASLIEDYAPSAMERSMGRTMKQFKDDLVWLGNRIDVDKVDKDEFADLFNSSRLIIERTTREEKLRAVAALLANLLLKPGDPAKVSYEELDHWVRCLDALSIGAIQVLGATWQLVRGGRPDQEGNRGINFAMLHQKLDQMAPDLLMGLVGELVPFNLVRVTEPAIRTAQYHNYALQLTRLGARFVERFVEGNFAA